MPNTAPFVYSGESTREISFPLGGIGTGSIGLSGGGRLIDWEILNRPAKGITNGLTHFAVKAEQDGKVLDARILNGPYLGNRTGDFPADTSRNFGFGARRDSLAGMPHFATNTFEGRFPVAKLDFREPGVSGRRRAHRVQSLHPAQRPRLEHPGGDVRDRVHQPDRRRHHLHARSASSGTACTRRPRRAGSTARARPASRS